MKYKNEKHILKIIKYFPPFFILILSLLITFFVYIENKNTFEEAKDKLKNDYIKTNKIKIKEQIDNLYGYIKMEERVTEENLKDTLRQEVNTAYTIAMSLYKKNQDKTKNEIKKIILDALREIRFNKGRGYFFIYDLNHKNIMLPTSISLEGKNFYQHKDAKGKYIIRDMVKTQKMYKEAFYDWYWYKPNNNMQQYRKIGFAKNFEPFNWFIGTGEYIVDFEQELKAKILKHIEHITFNDGNGYIFVIDYNTVYLAHPRKEYIGKKASANNDAKDIEIVIKRLLEIAKSGGGFSSYTQFKKPTTGLVTKKVSYVKGIDSCQWMIGTGFYEDDLNSLVSSMKRDLDTKFSHYIENIFITSMMLTILFLLLSFYFSKLIERKFLKYRAEIRKHLYENSQQQDVLAQQSKMASMGEMLENIAHQWRQPLSVITTAASGLKVEKEAGISTLERDILKIDNIVSSAQYLSQTIDDFRDLFIPNKDTVLSNLQSTFDKTYNIFDSKLQHKNIIIHNIECQNFKYLENELIQVFINIVSNAMDALETQDIDTKFIVIDIKEENKKAIITIKDNAGGIPESIINRVFEPYFTTKYKAQGTGIGLYMSSEIITKHMQGLITVNNVRFKYNDTYYKGAEFVITLPIKLD